MWKFFWTPHAYQASDITEVKYCDSLIKMSVEMDRSLYCGGLKYFSGEKISLSLL